MRNVNSPLEKPRQLEQIQLSAQIARAHLEAAESVLQSGGSTGLALSNLIVAGLIFAACLNNLREAAQTGEALPRRPGRLPDRATDTFETIFPGTFVYTKSLKQRIRLWPRSGICECVKHCYDVSSRPATGRKYSGGANES